MASKDDVRDFFEFRRVLEGLYEGVGAAMRFMDDQGIAVTMKKKKMKANGHANGVNMETLRETVKRHYAKRTPKRVEGAEPTGDTLTVKQAAAILKVSDASVRNFVLAGKLPRPTMEVRLNTNGRAPKVMVLPREAVEQFAIVYKPNKNIQAATRRKRPIKKKKS